MVAVSDNKTHTSNLKIGGLNWFAYAYNNPLRYTDPSGLLTLDEFTFGLGHPRIAKELGQVVTGKSVTNISTNAVRIQH